MRSLAIGTVGMKRSAAPCGRLQSMSGSKYPWKRDEVMDFWTNKRVLVTGGAGFLGAYVVSKLRACGCTQIVIPRHTEYDLRHHDAIVSLLQEAKPHLIIHLAAVVGGIEANRQHPGK